MRPGLYTGELDSYTRAIDPVSPLRTDNELIAIIVGITSRCGDRDNEVADLRFWRGNGVVAARHHQYCHDEASDSARLGMHAS
jgi:hypothetical protein